MALDATMVVEPSPQRLIPAQDFFVGPALDIVNMTVLEEGEILTAVRLPNEWAGAEYYWEKVADRNVWDFALVSIAAAMKVSGGTIQDARLAAGAVECKPRRLQAVENALRGQQRSDDLAERVASIATDGARPLNYNHFKVPLLANLVKRAVRG
ncbi:MAG: FAD binding domain-containing protein [Pseudohongiellaceae bacterium]